MNKSTQLICAFSFALVPGVVMAQPLSAVQDTVIIRENRMQLPLQLQNRNISVLTREQIRQLPVKSVNELLTYVAGIDLRQRGPWGSQADVSIDGSTFDQVLVLVNGVKISDPQTGHNMLNLSLPIGSIDHIEVLRGPAARIYGVNALAGAINIVTAKPKQNEVLAQVYAGSNFEQDTATNDTYHSWGAQASASLVSEKMTNTIGMAHDEGNGYRYNTAFHSNRLFYENRTSLNRKNELEAFGAYSRNSFGANGYYSTPGDKESEETVETALGSLAWIYRPSDKVKITPKLSYRYNKDDYIYIRQKPEVYHNIHETNTVTGELQSSIKTKNGNIGLGAEWRNEQINSTNLGKRERYNAGFYAEYRHQFFARLNVSAGVYANYNSDYDWQVFPGIDAGLNITSNWRIFAAFTTGQRLPTYTDLYYKGPLNIGNDQLQPEFSTYAEGGLQFIHPLVTWKGNYFYRRVSDLIDWVRAADTLPWQPQNFQVLNTNGWTTQLVYPVSKHLGFSDNYEVGLNLSYTYLNQEIETGNELLSKYSIEALKHQAIGRVNLLFFKRVGLNIAGRYQQRINNNDYTVLDLRLSYRTRHILVYTDFNNLLNTQYKEIGTIQMPGKWFTLGVRYLF